MRTTRPITGPVDGAMYRLRALATWAAIIALVAWMIVGVAVGLLWCLPAWILSTLINWALDR